MKRKRTMRRFCKTCGSKTYFSKTKDPLIIVCMRCGAKKEEALKIIHKKGVYQSYNTKLIWDLE